VCSGILKLWLVLPGGKIAYRCHPTERSVTAVEIVVKNASMRPGVVRFSVKIYQYFVPKKFGSRKKEEYFPRMKTKDELSIIPPKMSHIYNLRYG